MSDSAHAALPDHPDAVPQARSPKLRGRLAALSIAGALIVALPLGQVLRFQTAEVASLMQQRAGLDPAARAVHVQRGLLVHRDIAARVLRGQAALEPERQQRQAEVGESVAALDLALTAGQWDRAVRESDALREDWAALVGQLLARVLTATQSDQAHRLLMEQALQVIDLLDETDAAAAAPAGDGAAQALAAWRKLPRLAAQLAALSDPGLASLPGDLAAAENLLAQSLGALNGAPSMPAKTAQAALAQARAEAAASAGIYFEQLRNSADKSAAVQAAGAAALQAQFKLFDVTAAAWSGHLTQRAAAAEQQRNQVLAALAGLALMVLLLAAGLWRGATRSQGLAAAALPARTASTTPPPNAHHRAAGQLLQRLRAGDGAAPTAADLQPTLPPAPH